MADQDPTTDDKKPATGDDSLGDNGKKALQAERKARQDAEKALADAQKVLTELQDKDKPEIERLTNQLAEANQRAEKAEAAALRQEVAMEKGLTAAQARRLVGATKDELEADANDLLETFGSGKSTTDEGADQDKGKPQVDGRPKPSLKGGSNPTEQPKTDIAAMVDAIPRSGY